ncbi:NlpC/P60 family protein [Cellulomonas sp. URHE0023]|uniref:C40 family peptidase n=1 Tax=Cellulomonas sp. URHE0023 TaxID=1380354 RepID=UPI0009DE2311|nr:C40 family peptidase [Cellulomonas sp. URHE0023]
MSPHAASRYRRSSVVVTAALVGALLIGAASDVAAAPPQPSPPSAQDVQDAKGAVAAASRSVAGMEVRLAQLSATTDAANLKVQQAGEAYTQAVTDADAAAQASAAAAQASEDADAAAEVARRQLVAIVREIARSGGSTDMLQALLSADGFQDVASRSSALDRISGKTDEAVQQYRASQLVSTTLAERATTAADVAAAAKTAAEDALKGAQQAQADAEQAQDDAAAERDTLIDQLAAARETSADVERARQDYLDQQRREREDAAAQAAALRAAPVAAAPVVAPVAPVAPPVSGGGAAATSPPATTPPAVTTPPVSAPPVTAPPTTAPPVVAPPSTAYGLGTGTSRGSAGGGADALAWAQTKIGLPYVWAAAGPDAFDCSGLTMTAWKAAGGVNLARTSRDQYKQVLKISYNDLRPGDLVFWSTDAGDPNEIYHVAMWAGGGSIMEAPQPGTPLRVTKMRWGSTMPFAGRP